MLKTLSIFFLFFLLVCKVDAQFQLPWKITNTYTDTVLVGSQFLFETSSAVRDNGPSPTFCSPLIGQNDTLKVDTLFYDLIFNVTPPWVNGCTRLDTFNYTFNLAGKYVLVCYWTFIDSLDPNSNNIRFHSDTNEIYVQANSTYLSEQKKNYLTVFPNPVSDKLNLQNLQNSEIEYIQIWNTKGQLIKSHFEASHQLDVSKLPCGIYFLKVIGKEKNWLQKFIKQ